MPAFWLYRPQFDAAVGVLSVWIDRVSVSERKRKLGVAACRCHRGYAADP